MQSSTLLSIATAVPPHCIAQEDAKSLARNAFLGRKSLFEKLSTVFDNAAIDQRYLVAEAGWYAEEHGWADRNRLYLQAGEALFVEVARKAIAQARLRPDDIDGVVFVSTTGIATPSLEVRAFPALGLRNDVRRVPIFGLGCAGGVSGLATAARFASAEPGSRWLFVTVETCSISIRLDSEDPTGIVATALFGDGAAAAVVQAGAKGGIATIRGSGEKIWRDTQNIMGWRVEDPGLAVVFDRAIPPFVEAELRVAIDEILGRIGTSRDEIDRYCCHPGGVKVLDAIETALSLPEGTLDVEREILRGFGNMSSPTVLFILERLIARGLPDRTMLTGFGPGFTCAGLVLDRC